MRLHVLVTGLLAYNSFALQRIANHITVLPRTNSQQRTVRLYLHQAQTYGP